MSFLGVILAPWTDHPAELRELRLNMASTKDMVARLNTATDELASDLADFRAKVANQDSALAAELDPIVSRLEEMGQDPKDPVPSNDGTPVENQDGTGSTPAAGTGDEAPSQNDGLGENEVSPETVLDENR